MSEYDYVKWFDPDELALRIQGLAEENDASDRLNTLVEYAKQAVRERDEARGERDLILCDDHTSAGRRFDIKCVVCRWDAERARADALEEALRDLLADEDALTPVFRISKQSARDALAKHGRGGGGR